MATRYPRTSEGQTFYNDNRTGAHYDMSELVASPSTPFPTLDTTTVSEQTKRIDKLESKIDSLLFILSAQSAKLTTICNKFDRLCELTGAEIQEEKPVEARLRDHEMKFEKARANANEAVIERKRTISNAAEQSKATKEGKPIVGSQPERKRVMSIIRCCADIRLNLQLRVFVDSMSVVIEEVQVKATDFEEFRKLLRLIHQCVETGWMGTIDVEKAFDIGVELGKSKWVMKLAEDGNVATLSTSPTRITDVDVKSSSGEGSYRDWYFRNVLKGQKQSYEIVFKADIKSDHARDMFKITENIPLGGCGSMEGIAVKEATEERNRLP